MILIGLKRLESRLRPKIGENSENHPLLFESCSGLTVLDRAVTLSLRSLVLVITNLQAYEPPAAAGSAGALAMRNPTQTMTITAASVPPIASNPAGRPSVPPPSPDPTSSQHTGVSGRSTAQPVGSGHVLGGAVGGRGSDGGGISAAERRQRALAAAEARLARGGG